MRKLTLREKEVMDLLVDGHTYIQISHQLKISPATVRKHISNIYVKLDVKNKSQAIIRYHGL